MPELRLQVDQAILSSINNELQSINGNSRELSANDIGREALAVYKWVVEQTNTGRAVVSTNKDLTQLTRITTPNLPAKQATV